MEKLQSHGRLAGAALEMVREGLVVGLGSGHAAAAFVKAIGRRVRQGLRIRAVATSQRTADLAAQLGIPLVSLDEVDSIDVAFDGADEVDPNLDLIKGLGGALVREKIVAASARRLVILVGEEKVVNTLGERGILPIEVVPFGLALCRRCLARLGYPATPREASGRLLLTDNGNHLLDCSVPLLQDPAEVEESLRAIPGVVGTGLFLGMADTVLIETARGIETRHRRHA